MAKRPNTATTLFEDSSAVAEAPASATTKENSNLREASFEVVAHRANRSLLVKDTKRKKLAHVYSKEPKSSVMVAPMYAAHFGKVMHVMINGISIAVPCDGMPYSIPKTFAEEVHRRLRAVNEAELKSKRFADVASNVERAPGELALY